MKLLIHYPSRGRKAEFCATLFMYASLLSEKHDTQIVVSADSDDAAMNNDEVRDYIRRLNTNFQKELVTSHYGRNTSKIAACNADMDKCTDWGIVLLASDDMIPMVQGYDDIIIQAMQQHFPDTDGALFFNDGTDAVKRNLNTLSILGRAYYNRFGYIYHPDYKSFFCDNEHTEVAQALGKLVYIDQVIIKHEHPGWGGSFEGEALYRKNNIHWRNDEAVYKRRKKQNFGLNVSVSQLESNTDYPLLLSICIPTVAGREEEFNRLYADLEIQRLAHKQYKDIEIIFLKDNKEMTIGTKRNELYKMAKGKYAVQIDDDDSVAPDFIAKVVERLHRNPDCVTYLEHCTMDGAPRIACHSNRFKDWGENRFGYDYIRTPFYKDVIRTSICRRIRFRDIRFAEDHRWARDLKAKRLIKTEEHIPEHMYFYTANSLTKEQTKERYGIRN